MSGAAPGGGRAPRDQAVRELIAAGALHEALFVEAGAGTGKTRALVDRIVNLVLEGHVPVREVAAITFTDAAAAELRDRVRETFERRLVEEGDGGRRARCEAALADLDVAAISTLHSFAERILSEHPVEAGLPPRIEVADEIRSQLDFEDRWRTFLDRLLDDPRWADPLTRASLLGIRLDSRYRSSLKQVAAIFDEQWDRLEGFAAEPVELAPVPRHELRAAVEAAVGREAECRDPEDDLLAAHLRGLAPEIERVRRALDDADDLALLRVLVRRSRWACSLGRAGSWPDVGAVRDALAAVDARCAAVLDGARDAVLRTLAVPLAAFTLEAAEERRRAGRLGFHDLLVLARRLLRGSASARRALHARYTRLLVDEFQDTDPIQVELAVLVAASVAVDDAGAVAAADWESVPTEPGRLFFVGDPKQSIYRFRGADIAVFLRTRACFADDAVLQLTECFRAEPTIVAFVNHVFARIMAEELPERRAAYQPLDANRDPGVGDHRVVVLGGPHDPDERRRAADLRALEAADVAVAVDDVRRHPDRWPVLDPEAGWRAARLEDVAILLPARTSLAVLQAELDAHGIPYRTDTGSLVYDTQEVRDLLAIVRSVADPADELAVVAALRAPAFGCGDDDLFTYHAAGGSWSFRAPPPAGLPAGHPVPAALEYLRGLNADRWWTDPAELLGRVVRERRVLELAFAHRRPRDVWRRIRYVLDQAREFSETIGGDLLEYAAWADLQRMEGARVHEPMLPEADDEAVRILTVHGAKGLEFPITVVSGLTTRVGPARRGVRVHWSEDGRPEISLQAGVRTSDFDRLAELEGEIDEYERERLLYVALTRARDHLVVSAHHGRSDRSFAATVWAHLPPGGEWWRPFEPADDERLEGPAPRAPVPTADSLAARDAWWAARRALLDRQAQARSVSATELARRAAGGGDDGGDGGDGGDPGLAGPADDVADDDVGARDDDRAAAAPDSARPAARWHRGRGGTAVGRAVHAVLQAVDPVSAADLEALAAVHAEVEGVPERAAAVAALARAALAAPVVREAVAADRTWRETYVAAPVGDRVVEGYVDLLFDTPDGLVVVDYKTDALAADAEADADRKLARYRLQGAAYAVALEEAAGRPVARCVFVFTRAPGAIEREVTDLRAAMAEVRALVATHFPLSAPAAPDSGPGSGEAGHVRR